MGVRRSGGRGRSEGWGWGRGELSKGMYYFTVAGVKSTTTTRTTLEHVLLLCSMSPAIDDGGAEGVDTRVRCLSLSGGRGNNTILDDERVMYMACPGF